MYLSSESKESIHTFMKIFGTGRHNFCRVAWNYACILLSNRALWKNHGVHLQSILLKNVKDDNKVKVCYFKKDISVSSQETKKKLCLFPPLSSYHASLEKISRRKLERLETKWRHYVKSLDCLFVFLLSVHKFFACDTFLPREQSKMEK